MSASEIESTLHSYLVGYLEGAESDLPADLLAEDLADILEEKGYRKPRIIATQEEVNNLPVGAIVLDAYAATCTRLKAGLSPYDWMRVTTAVKGNSHHRFPYLPAEVVYVPEETP